jgi:hypothetical protein
VASAVAIAGSVIARVRSYLSTQHLFAAEHSTYLAADYEAAHRGAQPQISLTHRAYVMGAELESGAPTSATRRSRRSPARRSRLAAH